MRVIFMRSILWLCCLSGLWLPSVGQNVRVAVAANAQFVAEALKHAFEQKHAAKIELVISSSGKLTAQMEQGAPYGVFLSADMSYPETLYKKGFTTGAPRVYAMGKLVLWTLRPPPGPFRISTLKRADIKTIAVANPATAPYGVAALEALKKTGNEEALRPKIVYGESISQVNQYLLSGAADAAFTAKSVVVAPTMRGKGRWTEVDDSLYQPISQGAVVLKSVTGKTAEAAQAFYRFLFSPEARAIFKTYGYKVR